MKIIYFAHSVLNRGGDKVVLAHLSYLAASGHQVIIKTNIVNTVFDIHPDIEIEKLALGTKSGTLVCALFNRMDADCIIASIVATAVVLSFRNMGRVVHFSQDDNETAHESLLYRSVMRALYRFAFTVLHIPTITVSRALADSFRKRFGVQCTVVGNGVDTSRFFPEPSAQFQERKSGEKAILVLARNDFRKGFDSACRVIGGLAALTPTPVCIWSVGNDTHGLEFGAVPYHSFGMVTEPVLRVIMSNADVFLYPSRSEGFGLMVLEAFACRCPVVTTSAVPFVIDHENALVSPVSDIAAMTAHVAALLDDKKLADSLADQGYQFALKNSQEASSKRFEELLLQFFAG